MPPKTFLPMLFRMFADLNSAQLPNLIKGIMHKIQN